MSVPWAGIAENGNLRERFSNRCPVDLRKEITSIRMQVDVTEDYNPNPETSPDYDPEATPFLRRKKYKFDVTFARVMLSDIRASLLRDDTPEGITANRYFKNRGACFPNDDAVLNSTVGLVGSLDNYYVEKVPVPLDPEDDEDNYRVFPKGSFLLIGDRCCPLKQMLFSRGVTVLPEYDADTDVLAAGYVANIYVPLDGPSVGVEDHSEVTTGSLDADLPELFCYECKAGIPVWAGPAPAWETPFVETSGDNVTFAVASQTTGDATHDAIITITANESGPVDVLQYFKWVSPAGDEYIFKVVMKPRENSGDQLQQLYHFVPGEPYGTTHGDPPRVWWRDHDSRFGRHTQSWPNVAVSVVAVNGEAYDDARGAQTGRSSTGCFLFSAGLKADGFAGVAKIAFIGPFAKQAVGLPVRDTVFTAADRKSILWRAGTQPATDFIKEPWAYDYILGGEFQDAGIQPYKLNVMEVARDINPASWSRSFDKLDPISPDFPYSETHTIRRYGSVTYTALP